MCKCSNIKGMHFNRIPEFYLNALQSFSEFYTKVRATRSLVLCICFVDRCLSFCTFSFGRCVFCSSIYEF